MTIEIPISDKYRITTHDDGTIGFTYGGGAKRWYGDSGLTMLIPHESIQAAIDALERAKKLVVLK